MQKRVEEVRSVLVKITESEAEAGQRLAKIEVSASVSNTENKAVWQELLRPSPALSRMMITGLGIQCFQQITGIDAPVYYSPTIFQDAGIKSETENLAATIAVGVSKTSFILVAIFLINKVGRKPLLYVSTIGMTVCLFGLGLSLSLSLLEHELVSPMVGIAFAILAVCSNVAFFSVGIGHVCWLLSSEIFSLRVRAQAGALGAVGNRLSSGLVAMSFLSITEALSVGGTRKGSDVPDHSEMANGAGSDNLISLSLGAGGHVDHASTNELKSKPLFTTQETDTVGCPIMVVLIYTSLLLSMYGPRSNKSTPNGRRSEGPFSHPRQPRSVRPRLYLSIENDSD